MGYSVLPSIWDAMAQGLFCGESISGFKGDFGPNLRVYWLYLLWKIKIEKPY